uniref:Uncharacterized protein n=1 Tax=Candidatus Methanogaster sp. ANME-2c ERB4 TaxID=2759911 RepID=A0A7G9YD62_9EURY|nr:hypothetical protein DMJHIOCL_00025 [Methanosarcinales archaeon ANME-2c ERB4]
MVVYVVTLGYHQSMGYFYPIFWSGYDKTRGRIDKQLKTMKAKNFVDYDLEPRVIKAEGKEINSFHIVPKETDDNREAIKKTERTDGLWTIVTNTSGNRDDKNRFAEDDPIRAYRDKNQIKQALSEHIIQYAYSPICWISQSQTA